MNPCWLSWWHAGAFELHSPWWESGWRILADGDSDQASICAAVMAENEDDAKRRVVEAHDDKSVDIEWRFVKERAESWEPFCERFPRAGWMQ